MNPQQKLSPDEIETTKRNIKVARETLDDLFNYERAGIDVTEQRNRLLELIARSEKLLEVFGS